MSATDRASFLAERKRGIGGSDVAAALGIDPRKTPYQLWREKVGADDNDAKMPPAARRGLFLENAVMRKYAALRSDIADFELQVRHSNGWRRGTQDARAIDRDGQRRVVEIKTVNRHAYRAEWGTPWSDEVPDRALCQGLWYANLDAAVLVDFAVLVIPDDPDEVIGLTATEIVEAAALHVYQVARHKDLEQSIVDRAGAFWQNYVVANVAPPPSTTEDCELRWPLHIDGKTKPAAPVADLLQQYADAVEFSKGSEEHKKKLRERLLIYAEDAEALIDKNGSPLLTIKAVHRAGYTSTVQATDYRTARFTKWWDKAKGAAPLNPTATQGD